MLKRLAVTCLLCAAACNPNSLNGTVSGVALDAKNAAFAVTKDGNGNPTGMALRISDQPDVCGDATANRVHKNSVELTLFFIDRNPDGSTIAPAAGTYTVYDSVLALTKAPLVTAQVAQWDSACDNTIGSNGQGQSGTVTVSSYSMASGGHTSGTFDITFGGQGDKTTGDFSAVFCDLANLPISPNCE